MLSEQNNVNPAIRELVNKIFPEQAPRPLNQQQRLMIDALVHYVASRLNVDSSDVINRVQMDLKIESLTAMRSQDYDPASNFLLRLIEGAGTA